MVFYIFSLGIKLDFRHLKTLFYYCSGIIDWIILEEDITTHTVVRIMVFRMHSETKFLKKDRDFEIFNLHKFRFEVQIKVIVQAVCEWKYDRSCAKVHN